MLALRAPKKKRVARQGNPIRLSSNNMFAAGRKKSPPHAASAARNVGAAGSHDFGQPVALQFVQPPIDLDQLQAGCLGNLAGRQLGIAESAQDAFLVAAREFRGTLGGLDAGDRVLCADPKRCLELAHGRSLISAATLTFCHPALRARSAHTFAASRLSYGLGRTRPGRADRMYCSGSNGSSLRPEYL